MKAKCRLAIFVALFVLGENVFALDMLYKDNPISINVSSDVGNIIRAPGIVQKAYSSTPGVDAKIHGNEVVFSVSASSVNAKTGGDLFIQTYDKTYLLLWQALPIPPTVVNLKDAAASIDKEIDKGKEYEDYLANIIAKAIKGELVGDFEQQTFIKNVDTPDFAFIFEKKYIGSDIDLVVGKVLNKTKDVKKIREDSRIVKDVVEKATRSKRLAAALSKEKIKPGESAILWAPISKKTNTVDESAETRTEEDRVIEKYIREKESVR